MKKKKTKEIIAESFLELSEEKDLDKITITNITDNGGLSQPTFYNHFKDKYDLIYWIYMQEAESIVNKIGKDNFTWRDSLIETVRGFRARSDFIKNALLNLNEKIRFIHMIQKININYLIEEVKKVLPEDEITTEIYGAATIFCYGSAQFMFETVFKDCDISEEEMVDIIESSLPGILRPYLIKDE